MHVVESVLCPARDRRLSPSSQAGLFSAQGDLIEQTRNFRFGKLLTQLPNRLPLKPSRLPMKSGTYLYGGGVGHHYGHCITENVARLWYLDRYAGSADITVLFWGGQALPATFRKVLITLGLTDLNIMLANESAYYERVIIPDPSLVLGSVVHPAHPRLLQRNIPTPFNPAPNGGVYLSRRLLQKDTREVQNEQELEAALCRLGITVIHPQFLSIPQQIWVFNSYETIIGALGSALHNILFSRSRKRVLYLCSDGQIPNMTFPYQDVACNSDATYLSCISTDASGQRTIDVAAVVEQTEMLLGRVRTRDTSKKHQ